MKNTGTTYRVVKHKDPYTRVVNSVIEDISLSWAARGLLVYLLSKPDDWTVKTGDLIRKSPAGRDHVLKLLKELEGFGYLKRFKMRNGDGTFFQETHIFERPQK